MTRFPAVGNGRGELPIASKDRAETFAESDVALSHSDTAINSESVELSGPIDGSSIDLGDGSSGSSAEREQGIVLNPNNYLAEIEVATNEFYGEGSDIRVERLSDNTIVESVATPSAGATVRIVPPDGLAAGTEYAVYQWSGSDVSMGEAETSPPVSTTDFDITGRWSDGTKYDTGTIMGITLVNSYTPAYNGTVTVEWTEPDDIYRWDAATFQTSADGETVEVYVEESTDGGSTWTEIKGPIGRGDQIEADPGSRVRFRVELARSDTSNNPTLDAIYRRWVV